MKNKLWVKLIFAALAGIIVASSCRYVLTTPLMEKEAYFNKQKVSILGQIVGKNYIEEAPEEDMLEGIYRGFVYGLGDAKTMYLSEEEFTKMQVESQGDYIGTGIRFAWGITSQHIIVTNVVEGSPAELAGIVVGDKITAIDGVLATLMNQEQIYEKLLYTGSEPVIYTVQSNDGTSVREVELVASVIPITLTSNRMLDDTTGYINIEGVAKGTTEQVYQDIQKLRTEGAKRFILDIRDTTTNELEEVIGLIDLFVEEGTQVRVQGKEGVLTIYEMGEQLVAEPINVLINGYTSGVMEAFANVIKEMNRGILVGEKTSGDGSVQELVPLGDGSGLSVTTGYIVSANGEVIYERGVEPDIDIRNEIEYTLELVTSGRVDENKDLQLQEAIGSFSQ